MSVHLKLDVVCSLYHNTLRALISSQNTHQVEASSSSESPYTNYRFLSHEHLTSEVTQVKN